MTRLSRPFEWISKVLEVGGLHIVLRDAVRVSAALVISGGLGIAFVPFALRRLGEEGYGLLSVYWLLVGYLALVELGLGKNLLRELASSANDADRRANLQRALSAYVMIAVGVTCAIPVLVWAVPRFLIPVRPSLRFELGLITTLAVIDYLLGILVSLHATNALGAERFNQYARFQSISGVLRYAAGFLAIMLSSAPTAALVAAAFVSRRLVEVPAAVRLLGALPAGTWRTWRPSFRFDGMLTRSTSLSLAQWLQTTMVSIGSVLIGHMGGLAALGLYRACFDLASKLWFVSNAFGLVLFPRLARLQATPTGRARLAALLPIALAASAGLLGLAGVVGTVVARPLLPILAIEGSEALPLFCLLLGGVALHAHANLSYELLQARGRFGEVAAVAASALATLVGVFLALRTMTPLIALGWAWFLSQAVYAIFARTRAVRALTEDAPPGTANISDEVLLTFVLGLAAIASSSLLLPARASWIVGSLALVAALLFRSLARFQALKEAT